MVCLVTLFAFDRFCQTQTCVLSLLVTLVSNSIVLMNDLRKGQMGYCALQEVVDPRVSHAS